MKRARYRACRRFIPAALVATFYAATDDSFDTDYDVFPDPDAAEPQPVEASAASSDSTVAS